MPRYIEESELIDGRVSNDPVVIAVKCAKTADVVEKKLYDRLLENSIVIVAALNTYQTADVVEVVRCKDCKYYDPEDKKCDCGHGILWQLPRHDNWFCADGKRRQRASDE